MMVIKRVFVWLGISLLFVGCIGPGANRSDSLIVIDAGHGGHDCGRTLWRETGKKTWYCRLQKDCKKS